MNDRIKKLIKEEPEMLVRWRRVLNELRYEGFGSEIVHDINIPYIAATDE